MDGPPATTVERAGAAKSERVRIAGVPQSGQAAVSRWSMERRRSNWALQVGQMYSYSGMPSSKLTDTSTLSLCVSRGKGPETRAYALNR